eukprot:3430041-Prymnesium_polylepis.1
MLLQVLVPAALELEVPRELCRARGVHHEQREPLAHDASREVHAKRRELLKGRPQVGDGVGRRDGCEPAFHQRRKPLLPHRTDDGKLKVPRRGERLVKVLARGRCVEVLNVPQRRLAEARVAACVDRERVIGPARARVSLMVEDRLDEQPIDLLQRRARRRAWCGEEQVEQQQARLQVVGRARRREAARVGRRLGRHGDVLAREQLDQLGRRAAKRARLGGDEVGQCGGEVRAPVWQLREAAPR